MKEVTKSIKPILILAIGVASGMALYEQAKKLIAEKSVQE